jgi:hypothetical protein
MYIPMTMSLTLQDCVIATFNEYFKFIESENKRLQLTEKEAITVVYKHYNRVCLHLTKCLIGKGDAGKKFFPELEEEFLKATGISIATEDEHNNSPSNPKGV